MAVIMGIMILLMAFGTSHIPMMGVHGKAAQTQESVTPASGEENCQQCPQQEQLKNSDEIPAN